MLPLAQFPTSYPQTYPQDDWGHVMAYRSSSRAELRSEASVPRQQFRPRTRDVIVSWSRAREYRDGEARYLQLARSASNPDVRERFVASAFDLITRAEMHLRASYNFPLHNSQSREDVLELNQGARACSAFYFFDA
jgi:hypothetical protein